MKHQAVIVAVVAGLSLIASVTILSSALRDYGRSLERAASNQRDPTVTVPDHLTISFESGNSPVRLSVDTTPWTRRPERDAGNTTELEDG